MSEIRYLVIPFAHGGITTSFTLTPSVRTPRSKFWNGTKWNEMVPLEEEHSNMLTSQPHSQAFLLHPCIYHKQWTVAKDGE